MSLIKPMIIIYDRENAMSLKAKHKAMKEHRKKFVTIDYRNTEAVSKALEGKNNKVMDVSGKKLDMRRTKGDDVVSKIIEEQKSLKKEASEESHEVEARQDLSQLRVVALKDICLENQYPEAEWKKLKKADLIAYIESK